MMFKTYTVQVNKKDLEDLKYDNSISCIIEDILQNYQNPDYTFQIEICLDGYCYSNELNVVFNYLVHAMITKTGPFNLFDYFFDRREQDGVPFEKAVDSLFRVYLAVLINDDDGGVNRDEFEATIENSQKERISASVFLDETSFESTEYYDKLIMNKGKYIPMFTFNYLEKYYVKNTYVVGFILPALLLATVKTDKPIDYWIEGSITWLIRAV